MKTVRVARAAFPRRLVIRVRGELGLMFRDEDFAALFPVRGKPAWSPGRLTLVVLRFVENLTSVLVCATVAMARLPRLRRLGSPVIAVGTMSLAVYVGHFAASSLLSAPAGADTQQSRVPLLGFILGAILLAAMWSRFFRRGPLECLLHAATKPAKYIR